jgi:hypothetical protein
MLWCLTTLYDLIPILIPVVNFHPVPKVDCIAPTSIGVAIGGRCQQTDQFHTTNSTSVRSGRFVLHNFVENTYVDRLINLLVSQIDSYTVNIIAIDIVVIHCIADYIIAINYIAVQIIAMN